MTFEEWLKGRLPYLLRLATVLCGSPHSAEDVVQDVLEKAHSRWARIQTLTNPDAYVRQMVINEHLSWRRRIARSPRRSTIDEDAVPDQGAAFDQRWADRAELVAEIGKLPARQRAVIVLRYFEDLSIEESAETLHCAESTVRAHTARALARLRVGLAAPPPQALPAPTRQPTRMEDHRAN